MLQSLHIRNYALIRELDIDFGEGFSVITGETGAGKSIILGALGLAMGAKADARTISEGCEKCYIEADFGEYLIRRELNANGRSRSLVNDEIVSQADLRELSARLIDIHSQHANLLVGDSDFQRSVVDTIADNASLRETYTTAYTAYREAEKELADLQALSARSHQDEDYMRFQLQQLTEANLREDEQEELEEEEYRLSNAVTLGQELDQAIGLIGDEGGALAQLQQARIEDAELGERLQSMVIELKDILRETERLRDRTEPDPERLQQVQERLDMLNTLQRKHSVKTVAELIAIREDIAGRLSKVESLEEDIERVKCKVESVKRDLEKAASVLTESRMAVREQIADSLVTTLSQLGIRHPQIDIRITSLPDYDESGHDEVTICFAANLGQTPRPVAEVASGGEISRVMLAIKGLMPHDTQATKTLLFDEIDTGVSGEIATQMGRMMREMAESRQIIAITHLPQIALQGEHQYEVYKADKDDHTETHIRLLDAQAREQYIKNYNDTLIRATQA